MAFWKRGDGQRGDETDGSGMAENAARGISTNAGNPIQAQSQTGRTPIRVSADDPAADFQTLSEAIQAARPFDTISIGKGWYREDIAVDKPLHFIGDSGEDSGDYPARIIISPLHTIDWSQGAGSFENIWLTILPGEIGSFGIVESADHVLLSVSGGELELKHCLLNGRSEALVKVSGGKVKARDCTFDRGGLWTIKGEGAGGVELISCKFNSRHVDDWENGNDYGIEIEGSFAIRLQGCETESPIDIRNGDFHIQDCTLSAVRINSGKGEFENSIVRDLFVGSRGSVAMNGCQLCNYLSSSLTVMMEGRATLANSTIVPSFILYKNAVLSLENCIVVESPKQRFHWIRDNSVLNAVDTVFASGAGETLVIEPGCTVHVDGQRFLPNYDFR